MSLSEPGTWDPEPGTRNVPVSGSRVPGSGFRVPGGGGGSRVTGDEKSGIMQLRQNSKASPSADAAVGSIAWTCETSAHCARGYLESIGKKLDLFKRRLQVSLEMT